MEGLKELVEFYGMLIYIIFYPFALVWLALMSRAGVYSWVILGVGLVPPTMVWYIVVSRRVKSHLRSMMNSEPKVWDVKKAAQEYLEVLEKRNANKQSAESNDETSASLRDST